jgi:cell division protein FtsQ
VVERKPVAFVRQGNTIGLVDANGVLLSMAASTMAQHHYSFPVVTGIDPADPIASRKARMTMYLRMLAELDANDQHFSEQISEIDLTDPEDARVLMPEQGDDILAHFGEDQFAARYRRYKEHIAEWKKQYPRLASVDLRYDQQVVLQMKNAARVEEGPSGKGGPGDKAAGGDKPAGAEVASLKTTAAKMPDAKTDGEDKPGTTSASKPKKLTAKQQAAKEEAVRERVLEAKAARMRAAREKAAAAKQNKKPITPADAADQNKKSSAAQPVATNLNGQKPVTTPRSVQSGTEGQ